MLVLSWRYSTCSAAAQGSRLPVSMAFPAAAWTGLRDWLYGSIAELSDPNKALMRWLAARGANR